VSEGVQIVRPEGISRTGWTIRNDVDVATELPRTLGVSPTFFEAPKELLSAFGSASVDARLASQRQVVAAEAAARKETFVTRSLVTRAATKHTAASRRE